MKRNRYVWSGLASGLMVLLILLLISGCSPTDDDVLHMHMISGSREYQSESSLRDFKLLLEQEYEGIHVTASWGEDAGDHLPDIELLEEADLMLVFTRRMVLPENQLDYIIRYVEADKPVLGLKTSSHAFQGFLELDSLVFGGDYDGHGPEEPSILSYAENATNHPILQNVDLWGRPDKIYHNPELGPNTEVLIYGEGLETGIYEPLAWTNIYSQNGRAFYTSMGVPEDFESENFIRLLVNAISWTTEHEL